MVKSNPGTNSDQSTELSLLEQGENGVEIHSKFSDSQLKELTNFQSAVEAAVEIYGGENLVLSRDLGDGFIGLSDKNALVGKRFIVVGWGLGYSEYGDTTDADNRYSIIRVITDEGEGNDSQKLRFVDGSTGVHQTFMEQFKGKPENFVPVLAEYGLSKGEYTVRDADGTPAKDTKGKPIGKGTTFRIAVDPLPTR